MKDFMSIAHKSDKSNLLLSASMRDVLLYFSILQYIENL